MFACFQVSCCKITGALEEEAYDHFPGKVMFAWLPLDDLEIVSPFQFINDLLEGPRNWRMWFDSTIMPKHSNL